MISGQAIETILRDYENYETFVKNLLNAKGLIVYRASPSQKAFLVNIVRKICPNRITLAIGDGANDVNMIQ